LNAKELSQHIDTCDYRRMTIVMNLVSISVIGRTAEYLRNAQKETAMSFSSKSAKCAPSRQSLAKNEEKPNTSLRPHMKVMRHSPKSIVVKTLAANRGGSMEKANKILHPAKASGQQLLNTSIRTRRSCIPPYAD
jgi:hypothetical protein